MTWARPDLLALLLLVPLVLVVVLVARRARNRLLGLIAAKEALATLVPRSALRARGWQAVLSVVGILGLSIAAAGPRLGFEWQQQKVEGVAMMIVLDVSRSMDAQDVEPSRLERARARGLRVGARPQPRPSRARRALRRTVGTRASDRRCGATARALHRTRRCRLQ